MSAAPETIIEQWMDNVNRLNVESIVDLYDDQSILLPTFSPHRLKKPQEINDYFSQLATRQNMRVELHQATLKKVEVGENIFVMTGVYSFHFDVDDANLTFPSRFTFVLDVSKERPIIHHHSSQIPRTLT